MVLPPEERRKLAEESSLLKWFPVVEKLNIPIPETVIVKVPAAPETIKDAAQKIGYPLFMKTDLIAGKHDWEDTCFVEKEEYLDGNIINLVSELEVTDMEARLPFNALVFREYIELNSKFRAFLGMPVAPERRYFINEGQIQCHHSYWCCSKDTEVLTEDGFKLFSDISDEKIFTLNPTTNKIEVLKPIKKISYHYTGKMVHISNHNFDMLITPEHRIPIIEKDRKIKLIPASELKYNYRIPRTGIWDGISKEEIEIGNLKFNSESFFEFMGYFLSEGTTYRSKKNMMISISPKYTDIIEQDLWDDLDGRNTGSFQSKLVGGIK